MSDPKRWIDDPTAPDSLRADLQSVLDHPPTFPLPTSLPTPAPSGGATGTLAALTGGGALLLLVGIGFWVAGPSASEPDVVGLPGVAESEQGATRAGAAVAPAESPSTDNGDVRADEAAQAGGVAGADTPSSAAPEAARSETVRGDPVQGDPAQGDTAQGDTAAGDPSAHPRPRAAPTTEPVFSTDDEIAHLASLRRASGNPALALRLAREGERRFRGGLFGEERQAIVALSLHALGRRDAATRAARAFLTQHPSSTFRRSIEEIITASEGSPSSGHQRP